MKKTSIVLQADSYKFSQYKQYPKGTTRVFSYIESRGGTDEIMMFGLQYIIKNHLLDRVTQFDIDYAEKRIKAHGLPFNREGWEYIVNEHNGKLPLCIRALPEGTVVGTKQVIAVVYNTDPKCAWLTSYIETLLLRVWYPITVATNSYECKKIIKNILTETADNIDGLPFKLHDFGYRGVSSEESAAIGGAAHLVNFMGSDTFAANELLTEYYGADMASFSIPASEHSTITSWGRENERQAYENMLETYGTGPIFACVSDSYNIFEAIKMWGTMKDRIKELGTTLVVRPDSGDPEVMSVQCVEELGTAFGFTWNSKGYRVLNNVRVIYGDGIDSPRVINNILTNLRMRKWSADNIAFGMGGGLLQKCNRDTYKFAMKCSGVVLNETESREVYKEPLGMSDKNSKRGFLDLVLEDGKYKSVNVPSYDAVAENSVLRTVYLNGDLVVDDTLEAIRGRAK